MSGFIARFVCALLNFQPYFQPCIRVLIGDEAPSIGVICSSTFPPIIIGPSHENMEVANDTRLAHERDVSLLPPCFHHGGRTFLEGHRKIGFHRFY